MTTLLVLRRALRFRWPLVLAILLPAVVLGVGAVETRGPSAVAVSVVGVGPEALEAPNADTVRFALGRYAVLLKSRAVLEEVSARTGVDQVELVDSVDIAVSQDAGNLAVSATRPTEREALEVSRAVVEEAVALGDSDTLASVSLLSAPRLESPGLLGSDRALEAAIVLAALLLAVGVAYALELLRPRIRTGDDAAEATGAPLMGNLPRLGVTRPRRRVASDDVILASARSLRSGFTATAGSVPAGPVLVVGTEPGAGATTVAFLLARTLSDRGESTVVLDLDLDGAGLTRRLDAGGGHVLADVLDDRVPVLEAVQYEGEVAVLASTTLRGADDLVDRRLPDLLKQVADHWDVVLCDTTPLLAGSRSEVVAPHTASAVVVVTLGTPRAVVERTAARLDRLGLPVRGVVLNHATRDG
jgi:Mrp family chromosome partitioning ATPase